MQEVMGGEFPILPAYLKPNKKENGGIRYASGRGALYSILAQLNDKDKSILLPDYLCDSVTRTVTDAGWKYEFYHIDKALQICLPREDTLHRFSAILLIHYFGMVDASRVVEAIRKSNPHMIIIEDDVQAFYAMERSAADYAFTGLRKWFPCPDGAMVKSKGQIPESICIHASGRWSSYKLAGNVLKNFAPEIGDRVALELLEKGEALLEEEYLSPCSEAGKTIFNHLDLDFIAQRRKENASFLHKELEKLQVEHVFEADGVPLFVPIFVKDRDRLRSAFFAENVFTPKHWPWISEALNGHNVLYEEELSLICDQRYGISHMSRQIDILKRFLDVG